MVQEDQAGRPAYREALQAIGHYFDQQAYRGIFVAELDEGYIGKARPADEAAELYAEGFSFPLDDVRALIDSPLPSGAAADGPPHCPYGYGLFMQAVGEYCDRHDARYVSVLEVTNGFVLCYTANAGGDGASGGRHGGRKDHAPKPERRRFVLDRVGIEEMMNQAGV